MESIAEFLSSIAEDNRLAAAIGFVAARAIAVLFPPLQGWVLDLVAIAMFGWVDAFLFAESGIMLGAIAAFSVARRLRERAVGRLTGLTEVKRWLAALSGHDDVVKWTLVRLATNPAFDYINYAAGLGTCSSRTFLISTFVGSVPTVFLFFYLSGAAMQAGASYLVAVLGALALTAYLVMKRVATKASADSTPEAQ